MKRFTATEKWAKPWFQNLHPRLKCLWCFICDNADAAGVWEPNFRLASFQIGLKVSAVDLKEFGDRTASLPSGKILVISFIEFQYGNLSKECRAHFPIFRALEKNSLSYPFGIPYSKAIHSLKEEEEDKEEDKERGECREGIPASSPDMAGFDEFWQSYPRREAKENARKAWKKHGGALLFREILVGIRLAKSSEQWTKDGGQFIPHPATWLNRHGWEDDPSTWPKGATLTVSQKQVADDRRRTGEEQLYPPITDVAAETARRAKLTGENK